MLREYLTPKRVLLLAVALAVAGLMVLPAGSLLSGVAGASAPPNPAASTGISTPASASDAGMPSLTAEPASQASLLAGLPPSISHIPWVQSLTHQGPSLRPLTSLPNLALLKTPAATTGGHVNPFYLAQPAPLGLGDFGLGAKPYAYTAPDFLGQVTFTTPPNVTDPGSTAVIETAGQHDGNVGNFYEFGLQLNTVVSNIAIPGSDQGFFWTQNVVNWNDTGIHFVDDTFNLSSATENPFFIAPGTIYSGCNNDSAGVAKILLVYGGVFQCVGGTVPISPASYPITIQLYNNASINAQDRTQVAYGFRITEAGLGKVVTRVTDVVVFNNPAAPGHAPANKPVFSVDGFAPTPIGLFRDSEIVLVGDIGGDNSVFRSLSGTVNLKFSNGGGSFQNVPSAYNFGGDTGETSTGIADYWTPSHTLVVNQGPAMLYGLWNAAPWASVNSGAIHIAGSITPAYGFVFVSNTPPILDPWGTGARDNMSWLPTTNSGTFSTWLPPLGAPWTTRYHVQAFADGFAEANGTPITGAVSSYSLKLTPAPGLLNAPLYMFSNAQAASLAKRVTGTAMPPFTFNGIVANVNFTFNHLNDFGYPSFVLFMAQTVSLPIHVSHTFQGMDSAAGNFYIMDFAATGSTGILTPAPDTTPSLPFFTSGINLFNGANDRVSHQIVAAAGFGLQVNLWQDTHTRVSSVVSELESPGVWVGESVDTTVTAVAVTTAGTGVTDMASLRTVVTDVVASGTLVSGTTVLRSLAVEGLSSVDGTYGTLGALNGAIGVSTGADFGASNAFDPYYYLPGTTGATVTGVGVSNGSLGANISLSERTSLTTFSVTEGSFGIILDNSPMTAISGVTLSGDSTGVFIFGTNGVQVSQVRALDHSSGVVAVLSSHLTIRQVTARDHTTGVTLDHSAFITVSFVKAVHFSVGVHVLSSTHVTITHVVAIDHSIGVLIGP